MLKNLTDSALNSPIGRKDFIPFIPLKDTLRNRPRGINELRCHVSTPWTHKSFIYNRRVSSQAGLRGFPLSPAPFFQWLTDQRPPPFPLWNIHQSYSVCGRGCRRCSDWRRRPELLRINIQSVMPARIPALAVLASTAVNR